MARLTLGEAQAWLAAEPHRRRGEFVIVLSAGAGKRPQGAGAEQLLDALLEALAPSEAARIAARITGLPKKLVYRKALQRARREGK